MAKYTETPILTEHFTKALQYVSIVRRTQIRKDLNQTPYIAHLLAVCSLVLEGGGNEVEAIAALFHDSAEDANVTFDNIATNFGNIGESIAEIVFSLTEDKRIEDKKQRKLFYLNKIVSSDLPVQRVAIADKLHNARSYDLSPNLLDDEIVWFYKKFIIAIKASTSFDDFFDFQQLKYQFQEIINIVGGWD